MTYRGYTITQLFPSGYYETYINNRFWKADTLQGIKKLIRENG